MHILLTNDDGIYAPGLRALERELVRLGNVTVVAPATEQSGVGHSITFLSPLVTQELFDGDRRRGWSVEGSPADCVKIGIFEFCPQRPDLIVSGINSGLNAGINVLYSGTVAAAIEGAFFDILSVAVSLEYDPHADYSKAARMGVRVIEQIVAQRNRTARLYNLNFPKTAMLKPSEVKVVPMGVSRWGETYEKRVDPRGRNYYWATNDPPVPLSEGESDLSALRNGYATLTPLQFDLTRHNALGEMKDWKFDLGE